MTSDEHRYLLMIDTISAPREQLDDREVIIKISYIMQNAVQQNINMKNGLKKF